MGAMVFLPHCTARMSTQGGDAGSGDAETVEDAWVARKNAKIGAGGSFDVRCDKFAAAICSRFENCCHHASSECLGAVVETCLEPGGDWNVTRQLAQAGSLELDSTMAVACEDAVERFGIACHKAGFEEALTTCLMAWVDPASLGEACVDGHGQLCGDFAGRCVPTSIGPQCVATLPPGADCPAKPAECAWGALCFEKKCRQIGTVCGTFGGDTKDVQVLCNAGMMCSQGECIPDLGASLGEPCAINDDCRATLTCNDGGCTNAFCAALD